METCGNSSSNIEKLADELCCDVGLNPANFGPNIAAAIQQEIDSASSGDGILENALKEQSFQKVIIKRSTVILDYPFLKVNRIVLIYDQNIKFFKF